MKSNLPDLENRRQLSSGDILHHFLQSVLTESTAPEIPQPYGGRHSVRLLEVKSGHFAFKDHLTKARSIIQWDDVTRHMLYTITQTTEDEFEGWILEGDKAKDDFIAVPPPPPSVVLPATALPKVTAEDFEKRKGIAEQYANGVVGGPAAAWEPVEIVAQALSDVDAPYEIGYQINKTKTKLWVRISRKLARKAGWDGVSRRINFSFFSLKEGGVAIRHRIALDPKGTLTLTSKPRERFVFRCVYAGGVKDIFPDKNSHAVVELKATTDASGITFEVA